MTTTFCPNCESERSVQVERKSESIRVRDLDIPVAVEYFTCDACKEEFDDPRADDPLEAVYREYRKRKGFVQPEEIRQFRKEKGLTQSELSSLLGWGSATLSRYENGALQDEAHDRALQMVMRSDNLLALLEKHPDALPVGRRTAILAAVKSRASAVSDLLVFIEERLMSYGPDLWSGYQRFAPEKFFAAVLYFCRGDGIPRTKLNKLLWYADFLHFNRRAASITGAHYVHCPYGPAPDKFDVLFAYLKDGARELGAEERSSGDLTWEVLRAFHEPNLALFSDTELHTLSEVKTKFDGYSSSKLSELSHAENGYKETNDGELISYAYADSLLIK